MPRVTPRAAIAAFVVASILALACGPAWAAAPSVAQASDSTTAALQAASPATGSAATPDEGGLLLGGFLSPQTLSKVAPGAYNVPYPSPSSLVWSHDTTDTTPSHYYLGCDSRPRNTSLPRDANGIPMVKYWFLPTPVYNPTSVANDAIFSYETWLHRTSDTDPAAKIARADFLNEAAWLKDHGMDGQGRLPYEWDLTRRDYNTTRVFRHPWYSAMAQGLAISTFARAYSETGDTSYLDAAKLAYHPFEHDVADGGVTTGGGKWFEEYPDSFHVLNGSIFAMLGVYDLWRLTGDQEYKSAFDVAVDNLATNLPRYESHGAILYELYANHYSLPDYYILGNFQLEALSFLTGDTRLWDTAKRWETQFRSFPAPEFQMRQLIIGAPGSAVTLSGTLNFFYRNYYQTDSAIIIRAKPAGSTGNATTVARVKINTIDDITGTFKWVTPPINRSMWYEFSVYGQPTRAPWIQQTQNSWARVEVRLTKPVLTDTRISGDPGTPNGDGWNDWVYAVYGLSGSPSSVNFRIYDAAWRRLADRARQDGGREAGHPVERHLLDPLRPCGLEGAQAARRDVLLHRRSHELAGQRGGVRNLLRGPRHRARPHDRFVVQGHEHRSRPGRLLSPERSEDDVPVHERRLGLDDHQGLQREGPRPVRLHEHRLPAGSQRPRLGRPGRFGQAPARGQLPLHGLRQRRRSPPGHDADLGGRRDPLTWSDIEGTGPPAPRSRWALLAGATGSPLRALLCVLPVHPVGVEVTDERVHRASDRRVQAVLPHAVDDPVVLQVFADRVFEFREPELDTTLVEVPDEAAGAGRPRSYPRP